MSIHRALLAVLPLALIHCAAQTDGATIDPGSSASATPAPAASTPTGRDADVPPRDVPAPAKRKPHGLVRAPGAREEAPGMELPFGWPWGGACGFQTQTKDGAWLLASARVHNIYMGSYWSLFGGGMFERQGLDAAWQTLLADPSFYDVIREYDVGMGQFSGSFANLVDPSSTMVSEREITDLVFTQAWADNETFDEQALYVVYLPPGYQSQFNVDNNAIGHHNFLMPFSYVGQTAYAVVEYGSQAFQTRVASHEIAEAMVDPGLGTWSNAFGDEIGDGSCANVPKGLDGYTVQVLWSNATCSCR